MASSRPIGFWLKLLDQLINEQFDSTLEDHGVTRRQWQLLNLLTNDDATQAEIRQQMTEGFTKADRASSNAFGAWAQETCPAEPPAGAPSEDESSSAP